MTDGITVGLARPDLEVEATIDTEAGLAADVRGCHDAALCPTCLVPSVTTHGCRGGERRQVWDVLGRLVVLLRLLVRRFVCENPTCPQAVFDERFAGIDSRASTARFRRWAADMCRGGAVRRVTRELGVPYHQVRTAVDEARTEAAAAGPGGLGRHLAIDECSVKKGHDYATVFSDPERAVVLDVAPGRGQAGVWAFAMQYSHRQRARVKVVTIDQHDAYRTMIRVAFPAAQVVADAFHLHRRVNEALAEVRKAAAGRVGDRNLAKAIKAARYALLRARDALAADSSPKGVRQRLAVWDACGLDEDLEAAYELKEAFRALMAIGRQAADTLAAAEAAEAAGDREGLVGEHDRLVAHFAAALDWWCALAHGSGLAPFRTLAKSFTKWRSEIVGYAQTGASNAFAEGINHEIKNQKRQAHGYPTWKGFRNTIRWCFGEVIDTCTGEILPLRFIPRGHGTDIAFTLQP